MNTASTTAPPPTAAQATDSPSGLVGIKINLPFALTIFPKKNLIGAILLHVLCERELAHRGLLHKIAARAGELNNAGLVFTVRDTGPALTLLHELLTAASLRSVSTVLYFDANEGFFCPHGNDNAKVGPHFTMDQLIEQSVVDSADLAKSQAQAEALAYIIERLSKGNPPPVEP